MNRRTFFVNALGLTALLALTKQTFGLNTQNADTRELQAWFDAPDQLLTLSNRSFNISDTINIRLKNGQERFLDGCHFTATRSNIVLLDATETHPDSMTHLQGCHFDLQSDCVGARVPSFQSLECTK